MTIELPTPKSVSNYYTHSTVYFILRIKNVMKIVLTCTEDAPSLNLG
jgi:hypothetical protein